MSAIAQALTSEDGEAVQLHGRQQDGSRLGLQAGVEAGVEVARKRATSSVTASPGRASTRENGSPRVTGSWTPTTPKGLNLDLGPGDSPLDSRTRSPSGASMRYGMLDSVPPRSSSISPTRMLNGSGGDHLEPPPSQPVFHSSSLPTSAFAGPTSHNGNGISPSPSSPMLHLPPDVASTGSRRPSHSQIVPDPNSLSVSSSFSAVTSNSSHLPAQEFSPYPPSAVSFNSFTDPDGVAALVQQLYARLDEQGVHGDGWDEGKERSRDGLILQEAFQEDAVRRDPVRSPSTRHLEPPLDQDQAAKAEHVLRRVDRYGFFSHSHPAALASQHNRLVTLTAAPFTDLPSLSSKKRSSRLSSSTSSAPSAVPARPQARNHPNRQSTASLLPSTAIAPDAIALETKRIDKWGSMLSVARRDPGGNAQDWAISAGWWSGRVPGGGGGQSGKYRRLQRRVFKGIPDRWRRAVWGLLLERMADEVSRDGRRGRAPTLDQLKREYESLVEQPYVQDTQIDLDVPRTISGHVMFHTRYGQGQRALFHVLHAFGLKCEGGQGGYCQGMGPIAATLLCYFEPERAYAGLSRLFDQYRLGHIFANDFPGLDECFFVQEKLIELFMPDVHQAFVEHCILPSAYAVKWYITLFTNSFPFATQLRLWDALLLEGLDVLIIIAVAIIWHFRHDFTASSASFESIVSSLSAYFLVESDDALLRWIRKTLRIKGLRDKMKSWRAEWQRDKQQ
ncbi:TBC domain-containing protein [Rhodotorula paludigena]|uniref:TBC domain-containing protein n=1 Tax=Rhodotorula paludigena TaxID=86838 RepID=UPI003174391E